MIVNGYRCLYSIIKNVLKLIMMIVASLNLPTIIELNTLNGGIEG